MPDHRARKILLILNLLVLTGILIHSIYRDIQFEKQYPGDLRNRVVGARLQKDGQSPYFYKWKKTDGYRYIDPQNNDSLKVSNITGSPFFHDLLIPICNLPQRTISKIWLWLQYVMLISISMAFISISKKNFQKLLVVNLSVIFTSTEAWRSLIANGQIYLFIALLITGIIYGILKPGKLVHLWTAAICAAMLVLVRPIAIVLFIPFILTFKSSYKFIFATAAILFFYIVSVFTSKNEKNYWAGYYHGLQEQVKLHQDENPTLQENEKIPSLNELEGFDFNEVRENYKEHPATIYSENGNVFVLFQMLTHKKISDRSLTIAYLISIIVLSTLFIIKNKNGLRPEQILLFSFLLYLLFELFSPVHRHQYNTVQWLPLLLLTIIFIEKIPGVIIFFLLLGLVLNIINFTFIPMRHTLGEYIWLISLFLIVFMKPMNKPEWKLL